MTRDENARLLIKELDDRLQIVEDRLNGPMIGVEDDEARERLRDALVAVLSRPVTRDEGTAVLTHLKTNGCTIIVTPTRAKGADDE